LLLTINSADNEPQIYAWQNEETEQELLDLLQWDKKTLALFNQHYQHSHARLSHLSSRCLLKELGLKIEKNKQGKPFLANHSQHISLSHNHLYSILALHNRPVGIDVEEISPRFMRLKKKFVDQNGLIHAESLAPDQQVLFFAYYWAAKEAVYKIKGESLANYAEMIKIDPFIPEKKADIFAYLEKSGTFAVYKLIFLSLSCNHFTVVAY
jgi:4'-phosphopantetheinyl transferase